MFMIRCISMPYFRSLVKTTFSNYLCKASMLFQSDMAVLEMLRVRIWLAQLSELEVHGLQSSTEDFEHPPITCIGLSHRKATSIEGKEQRKLRASDHLQRNFLQKLNYQRTVRIESFNINFMLLSLVWNLFFQE